MFVITVPFNTVEFTKTVILIILLYVPGVRFPRSHWLFPTSGAGVADWYVTFGSYISITVIFVALFPEIVIEIV